MFAKVVAIAESMLFVALDDTLDYKNEYAEIIDFCINSNCYIQLELRDDNYVVAIQEFQYLHCADNFSEAKLIQTVNYFTKDDKLAFKFVNKVIKAVKKNM